MAYRKSGTRRVIFFEINWLWYALTRRKTNIVSFFYKHQLGKKIILDEATDVIVKNKKITRWTVTTKE